MLEPICFYAKVLDYHRGKRSNLMENSSEIIVEEKGLNNQSNNNANRKTYISCLRIISCLSVIILHTNGIFWSRPHGRLWVTANFLETFFYFAVPIFFMISGATLLDYRDRYPTKVFIKKRFSKTVIPFLFWSIVAGLFNAKLYENEFDYNIIHILDNVLNTRYFSVYWFFISLYAVYLSIPLLSAVENKISVYTYTAVVGVICVGTLPLCFSLFKLGHWPITPPVVGGYIMYVLMGYIFSKIELAKKWRYLIYALGVLGWLLHFIGTIYLSLGTNEINSTFKGYLNLPAILQAVAVFNFFKYIRYDRVTHGPILTEARIDKLASYTLGIYLLHMFVINYVTKTFSVDTRSITWRVGGAFFVFVVSAILTGIIKKIPIVQKLLP